jgi:DNA-binding transcriptional regulator YiaG
LIRLIFSHSELSFPTAHDTAFCMTPAQCRAARGLLHWSQDDLARAADIGVATVRNFENERSAPQRSSLKLMRQAFEAAGVELIDNGDGPGVRLRKAR